jgi:hypothetical protein
MGTCAALAAAQPAGQQPGQPGVVRRPGDRDDDVDARLLCGVLDAAERAVRPGALDTAEHQVDEG